MNRTLELCARKSILFEKVSFCWILLASGYTCSVLCQHSVDKRPASLWCAVFGSRPHQTLQITTVCQCLIGTCSRFLDCQSAASQRLFLAGHDSFQECNLKPPFKMRPLCVPPANPVQTKLLCRLSHKYGLRHKFVGIPR